MQAICFLDTGFPLELRIPLLRKRLSAISTKAIIPKSLNLGITYRLDLKGCFRINCSGWQKRLSKRDNPKSMITIAF